MTSVGLVVDNRNLNSCSVRFKETRMRLTRVVMLTPTFDHDLCINSVSEPLHLVSRYGEIEPSGEMVFRQTGRGICHEEGKVFGRADRGGAEAGGARDGRVRFDATGRYFRAGVLPLEEAIRGSVVGPGPGAQATAGREHPPE